MKVFIWEEIPVVSNCWHPGGGVVVFAETLERAYEIAEKKECNFWRNVEEREKCEPDYECSVYGKSEAVYTFPNAGCC